MRKIKLIPRGGVCAFLTYECWRSERIIFNFYVPIQF